MDNIPFEKGVKDVKVDVPSKEVTVVYDASKNDAEGLVKGFAKIRVKAEACDAKCCQGTACKENCCKKGDCDKKCCAAACDKKPLATRSARTAPRRRSSPATNPNERDVRTFRLTAKKNRQQMLSVFSFLCRIIRPEWIRAVRRRSSPP